MSATTKGEKMYKLHTDGSCSGNGTDTSKGGWGYILLDKNENLISKDGGQVNKTTNNQMELTAMIKGLNKVSSITNNFFSCEVYSDSAYIINCIKQKWYEKWMSNGWINSKKEPVKNKELWIKLIPFFDDIRFSFFKVKGHSGNKWNEAVDRIAKGCDELV